MSSKSGLEIEISEPDRDDFKREEISSTRLDVMKVGPEDSDSVWLLNEGVAGSIWR